MKERNLPLKLTELPKAKPFNINVYKYRNFNRVYSLLIFYC